MKSLISALMIISLAVVPVLCTASRRTGAEPSPSDTRGSLRGALRALERRRRAPPGTYPLASFQDQEDPRDIIEYLGAKNEYQSEDAPILLDQNENPYSKAFLLGYLDKEDYPTDEYENTAFRERTGQLKEHHQNTGFQKNPSAFREREAKHHYQNEQLQDLFLKNFAEKEKEKEKEQAQVESDVEYAELLRELWEKYISTHPEAYIGDRSEIGVKNFKERNIRKRQVPGEFTPGGGWGPIAFKRKRSSNQRLDNNDTPDFLYSLKFVSQTDPAAVENLKDDKVIDEEDDPDISKILNSADPNLGYSSYDSPSTQLDLEDDSKLALQPLNFSPSDEVFLPDGGEPIGVPIASENLYPMTKRSTLYNRRFNKRNLREKNKKFRSVVTDPRIAKDLSGIFGTENLEPQIKDASKTVKRSSNPEDNSHEAKSPTISAVSHNQSSESLESHESHSQNESGHKNEERNLDHDHPHSRHEHDTKPPLLVNSNNDFEHSHEGQENKEIEFDDNEQTHIKMEHPIILKKKSIDWSKYFGIDKRKKKSSPFYKFQMNKVKRFMNSFANKDHQIQEIITAAQSENDSNEKRNPKKIDPVKLDNMDNKLKNMEGMIVDEALEYSNGNNDGLDTKEEQEMKEKIFSRLAAAYSMEKMRKALKEFKQSLQSQRQFMNNQPKIDVSEDKEKRSGMNANKVFGNNDENKHLQMLDPEDIKAIEDSYFENEQGAGHFLNGPVEIMSEGYMGGSGMLDHSILRNNNMDGTCPILDIIVRRCHSVDILADDHGQLFLPFCSLHQICYLCGPSSATGCDLMFLSEADGVCEGRSSCLRAARTALMALRDVHGHLAEHLEGDCSRNSCLAIPLRTNSAWLHSYHR